MSNTRRASRRCDGVTRREFVRVGGLSALGLGLSQLLALQATAGEQRPRRAAKQCILIWLDGGPSHLETFDPKPDAPREVRGPFGTIATSVPGIAIGELLPRTAQRMRDLAIVRSVTSTQGEHNFGTHAMLTGYAPTPALAYPTLGAVATQVAPASGALPSHVAIPNFRVGGGVISSNGFLPSTVRPFEVGGDPSKSDFAVRHLDPYPGVTGVRLARRREYLQQLEQFDRGLQAGAEAPGAFDQAYRLVTSPKAREAFDLEQEPATVRQRYGMRSIGQSCLLARRLVERGVGFVTVNNTGWDTHQNLVTQLKEGYTGAEVPVGLIPSLDNALASLIEDLQERGLLDETLVVVMGEFGRTPKLNTDAGRDHWPRVFSVAMAGGGVPGGQVIGASDAIGESPIDRPVTPADLAATIYTLLGIDPGTMLHTADGRPVPLNAGGEVIAELVG